MVAARAARGELSGGLPFNAIGEGPPVLVLQGLTFANRALGRLETRFGLAPFRALAGHRRVYVVNRRPGMARDTSLSEMAADYAAAIEGDFEPPVDVIGLSSGGTIALYLAAEHGQLVRRLVLQDAGPRLTRAGRDFARTVGPLAEAGRWREVATVFMRLVLPENVAGRAMASIFAPLMAWGAPHDPGEMLALLEAEERHDFTPRLGEIRVPTLVLSGELDPFCGEALALETAAGLADGRAIVYAGQRHGVRGPAVERDLVRFLVGESGD
ncbi:MAG: alpha/beta hydrolase [Candidatus Limnocylindrales bacterium]